MSVDARLTAFARAALRAFAADNSGLRPVGPVRRLGGSHSGAHHVFRLGSRRGPVILKVSVDPRIPVTPEARALRALPPRVGPTLLADAGPRELLRAAAKAEAWKDVRELNRPHGGCLVMRHVPGSPMGSPSSEAQVAAAAGSLLRLHRLGPRRLAPLALPSHPRALLSLLGAYLRAADDRRLLSRATQRQLSIAGRQLETWLDRRLRRQTWPEIEQFCHGDLRWHNFLSSPTGCELIDFEHAGLGDPALDLAIMICRTPLPPYDELRLLDAYLAGCKDRGLQFRYFTLRPIVGVTGALGGLLDLADVRAGVRRVRGSDDAHVDQKLPGATAELADALARVAGELRAVKLTARWPRSRRPAIGRSAGRIAVDGTTASLKSPLAAALAEALGVPHFNTGAVYRYAAFWALERDLDPDTPAHRRRLVRHLSKATLRLLPDGGLEVGRSSLRECLNIPAVEDIVASWAALPAIRAALAPVVARALAAPHAVVEGREVGTELLPRAKKKIYVDAPEQLRAAWLAERSGVSPGRARRLIARRDRLDRERQAAPLRRAVDARLVRLSPDQLQTTVGKLVGWIKTK